MILWSTLWKIIFFEGLALFELLFIFVSYKGFFEIKELLKKNKENNLD